MPRKLSPVGKGRRAPSDAKMSPCRRVQDTQRHDDKRAKQTAPQRASQHPELVDCLLGGCDVLIVQLRSRGPTLAMALGVPAPSRNMPLAISSSDTTFTCDPMGRRQDIMGEVLGGSFCLDGRNLTLRSSAR